MVKLPAPRRLVTAWIAVVVFTLSYLVVDGTAGRASTVASVAAIVLALVKLRIILREFMGIHHAPRILRRLTDGLLLVMGVALLGTYLVGRAIA